MEARSHLHLRRLQQVERAPQHTSVGTAVTRRDYRSFPLVTRASESYTNVSGVIDAVLSMSINHQRFGDGAKLQVFLSTLLGERPNGRASVAKKASAFTRANNNISMSLPVDFLFVLLFSWPGFTSEAHVLSIVHDQKFAG